MAIFAWVVLNFYLGVDLIDGQFTVLSTQMICAKTRSFMLSTQQPPMMKNQIVKLTTDCHQTSFAFTAMCLSTIAIWLSVSILLLNNMPKITIALFLVIILMIFLAPSPDNSLKFFFWDIQYAPAYNDASGRFPTGFRGDQQEHFRWVARQKERREVKMVPIHVRHLLGPPCAWPKQTEGILVQKQALFLTGNEPETALKLHREFMLHGHF